MSHAVSVSRKNFVDKLKIEVGKKPESFFLLFWAVLNLLQVGLMELTSDEGYYWFYAQHLQWGYYDHPPLVALLIKIGTAILPGELGVRFFNVVLSTGGLALFFTWLPDAYKRRSRTYLVLLSAPLLHYLTFLLFPDGPLLFFSLLFLGVYRRFLQKQNSATAALLGLSLALMAYSKYHGALVLLFTVIANPRLLKNGYFYLSLLIALLLFTPHLWWQYREGFPTVQYHLSGRTSGWGLRHVGEYLSQQLVAIGPGLIFIPFVSKGKDVFERTLKTIIIGTFIFFLISSFKTFVHFHWTSIAVYPLLYFAVAYYNRPEKAKL
ncbi:MAG: glycosyltransferase family 39 protein, partial [Bacteroidota bacterium]|nr:glycosyltransferase family 39 protein [Bacteroidota bacterium]